MGQKGQLSHLPQVVVVVVVVVVARGAAALSVHIMSWRAAAMHS